MTGHSRRELLAALPEFTRERRARVQRWRLCPICDWPLNPAAAAGGFDTHPGCEPDPEPQHLATVHQLFPNPEGPR